MDLEKEFNSSNLRVLRTRINNDMKWAVHFITNSGNTTYGMKDIIERLDYVEKAESDISQSEFNQLKYRVLELYIDVNDGDAAYNAVKDTIIREYNLLKSDGARFRFLTLIDNRLSDDRRVGNISSYALNKNKE